MIQAYSFAKRHVKRQIQQRFSGPGRFVAGVRAQIHHLLHCHQAYGFTAKAQLPPPSAAGILRDMGQGWLVAEAVTSLRIVWETVKGV